MKKFLFTTVLFIIAYFSLKAQDNGTKVFFYEITWAHAEDGESVYLKDGKPYTGWAWSGDGKTMLAIFDKGDIREGIVFHKNGQIAAITKYRANGRKRAYYDPQGNQLENIEAVYDYIPEEKFELFKAEVNYSDEKIKTIKSSYYQCE
jgi:hypothetical protein